MAMLERKGAKQQLYISWVSEHVFVVKAPFSSVVIGSSVENDLPSLPCVG